MSKNVAVFVDVANIFYAAKAAGVEIDYVTLLKSATTGRDFIRAYAYTGLDPENENQRQFQNFLARNGYKVVSKDIRKYGDGKVKANLDIELVVDMMKTARNVDIAVVVSGDGDFAPAIRAVQEMGVRVEVISFRGNTSSDLIEVADQFTDITQLAKVERSTRSGRRVAASETDLSMTAVPDKETEGAPRRRRRTTKAAAGEALDEGAEMPVAAAAAPAARASGRGAAGRVSGDRAAARGAAARTVPIPAARSAAEAIAAAGVTPVKVLPGERLSRVAAAPDAAEGEPVAAAGPADVAEVAWKAEGVEAPGPALVSDLEIEPVAADQVGSEATAVESAAPAEQGEAATREGEGRRRRRRRGGRGRGRGRGREREGAPFVQGAEAILEGEGQGEGQGEGETDGGLEAAPYAPLRAPQSAFGSIWDSQLGMNAPTRPASADVQPGEGEEDIEEPAIPEYLIAERRRGGQFAHQGPRGGRGGRAGRGAYAAALDRERFGRAGAPSTGWSGDRGARADRGPRPGRRPGPVHGPARPPSYDRPLSAEPWSEVPPDLEEQIRAQLAATRSQPAQTSEPPAANEPAEPASSEPQAVATTAESARTPKPRAGAGQRRGTRSRTASKEGTAEAAAPGTREGRARPASRREHAAAPAGDEPGDAAAGEALGSRPARGRPRRSAIGGSEAAGPPGEEAAEKPKRRTRARKTAEG